MFTVIRALARSAWARRCLWALCVVAAFVAIRHALLRWGDFEGYIACGEAAVAGRYGPEFGGAIPYWVWPPSFVGLCVPLALFARTGPVLPRLLWALVNLVLGAYAFRSWLSFVEPKTQRRSLEPLVAFAAVSFLALTVSCHQINLLVLALLLGGIRQLDRDRPLAGGALIGLSIAVKAWPALLLPYLLLRGPRRAVVVAAATVIASLAFPTALFGPSRTFQLTLDWLTRDGLAAGGSHGFRNQALEGVLSRLFWDSDWRVSGLPTFFVGGLGPEQTSRLALVLGGAAFLVFTGMIARRPASLLADVAVLVPAAQLLVSPVLWPHYLVNLWGALALIVWDHSTRRPPIWLSASFAGFLVLMVLQEPALVGSSVPPIALAYDSVFVMVTLVLCAAEASRRRLYAVTASQPTASIGEDAAWKYRVAHSP